MEKTSLLRFPSSGCPMRVLFIEKKEKPVVFTKPNRTKSTLAVIWREGTKRGILKRGIRSWNVIENNRKSDILTDK